MKKKNRKEVIRAMDLFLPKVTPGEQEGKAML
jgi:hypothetical protein